jgi:hypothetical protein
LWIRTVSGTVTATLTVTLTATVTDTLTVPALRIGGLCSVPAGLRNAIGLCALALHARVNPPLLTVTVTVTVTLTVRHQPGADFIPPRRGDSARDSVQGGQVAGDGSVHP